MNDFLILFAVVFCVCKVTNNLPEFKRVKITDCYYGLWSLFCGVVLIAWLVLSQEFLMRMYCAKQPLEIKKCNIEIETSKLVNVTLTMQHEN